VRTPIQRGNRQRAKECFELGKRRDFGVKLHAFAILNDEVYAYVSMPKDDVDAQYKLLGNERVKFTHTNPMPVAKGISNFIEWNIRQLIAKHPRVIRWDEEVPSRRTFAASRILKPKIILRTIVTSFRIETYLLFGVAEPAEKDRLPI
jgi:hypothetical protein